MEIENLRLWLTLDSTLNKDDAKKIRGYFGKLFWDNAYAHQHKADGSFIYQYPRVQYKVIDNSCLVVGFNEGLDIVKKAFYDLKEINLNGRWQEVLSKGLESNIAVFSVTSEQIPYSFLTPWLALNENNFEQYQKLSIRAKKRELLEKILVGNILSMSKSLGYTVSKPIKANIRYLKEVKTTFKGILLLGFLGTFSVNFAIPDFWGIGKSVSRGFGTIKKLI